MFQPAIFVIYNSPDCFWKHRHFNAQWCAQPHYQDMSRVDWVIVKYNNLDCPDTFFSCELSSTIFDKSLPSWKLPYIWWETPCLKLKVYQGILRSVWPERTCHEVPEGIVSNINPYTQHNGICVKPEPSTSEVSTWMESKSFEKFTKDKVSFRTASQFCQKSKLD